MRRNTMPSLAALLGLLAIAGYQNRDKIGDFLKNMQGTGNAPGATPGAAPGGGLGGIIKGAQDMAGQLGVPASVTDGIKGVVDSFRNAGHGAAADSWVGTGANQPVTPQQTETALGPDLIDQLAKQTGLSREDLLARLSQILPEAVDKMTPGGQLPA